MCQRPFIYIGINIYYVERRIVQLLGHSVTHRMKTSQEGPIPPQCARPYMLSCACPQMLTTTKSLQTLAAGGGGGGGGWGFGNRMIIDPQSVCAAINKEDVRDIKGCGTGRNRKWNGLYFKQLGKVRVIIFENIFAIVVPVDLSCYVFGRW